MSEAPTMRGQQPQKRDRLYFHPPHPWLTIRLHTGVLLILPQTATTHALERFQINPHGHMVRGAGAYQLAGLNAADWDIVWRIRDFYNDTQHGGASRLTDPQMIAWLQAQVKDSWFAAFWLQHEYELGQALVSPAAVAPVPAPAPAQTVAQWSLREKIVAMFKAVPSHLGAAARAQFEAFITPQNLALLAGFFVAIAAVQAIPGADAAVDALLTGLAWAMYGWAGLVATRDLIEAVIKAGRAQSQADIDQAAVLAASALIILGVTLFLKKLTDRVKVNNGTGPKPAEDPEPLPPKSPRQQALASYQEGKTSPATWSRFENLKNVDPENLNANDGTAYNGLKDAGYSEDEAGQVINSGGSFSTQPLNVGDPMYKFGSDGYAPDPNSLYYLDQNGFKDVMSQYSNPSTGELNSAGIKTYLALPCANQANAIYQGVVSTGGTGQSATIGPAFENFALTNPDGSILNGMLTLDGGGTQVSPPLGAITSLAKVSP